MDALRSLYIDVLVSEFRQEVGQDEGGVSAYRANLESKTRDELHELWESGSPKRALAERKRELAEIQQKKQVAAQRFVGIADLWAKKPYWKRLEAVALLLALDPCDSIQFYKSQPYLHVGSSLSQEADDLQDLLTRATVAKELPDLLKPAALLVWLERRAVPVPHELKSAVERYAPPRPVVTPLPAPIAEPVDEDASEPVQYTKGTNTRQRIQAILMVINAMQLDKMSIPDGGKKEVLKACLICPWLFSESTFNKAWQAALDEGKLRMENHEKYAKR